MKFSPRIIQKYQKMKIIISGAGAVGFHLAELLSKENQNIFAVVYQTVRLDLIGLVNYGLLNQKDVFCNYSYKKPDLCSLLLVVLYFVYLAGK